MQTTAPTERRRLGLDTMDLDELHHFYSKVRYDTGPIAEVHRLAVAQILEKRGVDNDVLAKFLRKKSQ
jgi:hypothetical protein